MKICLDAGHYSKYNRSPVVPEYYESDMTWKLQGQLKSELESYGITVITTRTSQAEDVPLEARGKAAKSCDLFISLHSNACDDAAVDYPLACCTVTGKADGIGQTLANTVHDVMGTRQTGRIVKKKGDSGDWYGVLRGAASVGVPGVLLEHSFHTNASAANWLLSDDNIKQLARAEAAAIAAYYGIKKQSAVKPVAGNTFLVKIICDSLNVRSDAGVGNKVTDVVHKNEVFTIVDTKTVGSSTWGKLKSGAGWINISDKYAKKI